MSSSARTLHAPLYHDRIGHDRRVQGLRASHEHIHSLNNGTTVYNNNTVISNNVVNNACQGRQLLPPEVVTSASPRVLAQASCASCASSGPCMVGSFCASLRAAQWSVSRWRRLKRPQLCSFRVLSGAGASSTQPPTHPPRLGRHSSLWVWTRTRVSSFGLQQNRLIQYKRRTQALESWHDWQRRMHREQQQDDDAARILMLIATERHD